MELLYGVRCSESFETDENDVLKQELKFWEMETIGNGDSEVVHSFQRDVDVNGSRYVVKLPFKPDHELIVGNFVEKKLESNNMVADYGRILDDYEKAKYK